MYSVLIVDDDDHDIQKVKAGIDPTIITISKIYTANNINQAKEIISGNQVDILLCDIEMPQGTGIELMEWGQEKMQDTVTVMLTCHADFKYAKQALQLGCLDYLLKPVNLEDLNSVLKKADTILKKRTETLRIKDYQQMWKKITPLVMESFWFNLINNMELSTEDAIIAMIESMNIPVTMSMKFFPILLTIQRYKKALSAREQKIIEHVIKLSVNNIFSKEEYSTQIIKLNIIDYIIILSFENLEKIKFVKQSCETLIHTCNEIYCDASCFIGELASVSDFSNVIAVLKTLKNENVILNQILDIQDAEKKFEVSKPNINLWTTLLKKGKEKEVIEEIFVYFKVLYRTGNIKVNILKQFRQDFLQMIYLLLNQNDISARELFGDALTTKLDEKAINSIEEMGIWVKHAIRKVMERIHAVERSSDVAEKVKEYIALHLDEEDLSRETIAHYTFLSPDYLSRIFKKKTGLSISDYMIQERFKKARELLVTTDLSISAVVSAVGYSHFSYFSKMFKKIVGCTPIDYRKKYKIQS